MRFLSLNVHTKFSRDFYHGEEKEDREKARERDRRNVTIGEINDKCTWNMLYHIYKCVLCVPSLYMCVYVIMYIWIRIYMYIRVGL